MMRTVKRFLLKMDFFGLHRKILLARVRAEILGAVQRNGITKILVFDHFFGLDLDAIRYAARADESIEIGVLTPYPLFAYVRSYLPESATELKGYYQESFERPQQQIRSELVRLLREIKAKLAPLVFVAPSDQFFWIREFVLACRESRTPFIVLDKEGTITDLYFDVHAMEIKKYVPPICDHVLVWSQRQKEFYLRAGCQEEQITIVGQPRSDYWFNGAMRKQKEELYQSFGIPSHKKTVLYFDFEDNNYIHPSLYEQGLNWRRLLDDVHSVLFEIARNSPDITILFKLHPQASNLEEIRAKVSQTGLDNIVVLSGANITNDLIAHSDLVIGSMTTALLDAMLAGKPVIYVFWGNIVSFKANLLPFDENRGIDVARSKEEFKRTIEGYIDTDFALENPDVTQYERRKLTDVYFYNPDGHVGERVLSKIKEILNTSAKAQRYENQLGDKYLRKRAQTRP